MNGPRFEPWAVELMADMSAAAQRQLNWNVMTVSAANIAECREKLKAGDRAAEKGGKVVALTVPMSFGARLNFASGFVFDAMPDWEGVMALPLAQKLEVFRDPEGRARLNALAQSPANPLLPVANWSDKVIFDVVAPENEEYRGLRVGDIAQELGESLGRPLRHCGGGRSQHQVPAPSPGPRATRTGRRASKSGETTASSAPPMRAPT